MKRAVDFISSDAATPSGMVVGVGAVESSFFMQATPSVSSFDHEDIPAILVFVQYLTQLEGPMWRQIRGLGLAYHYRWVSQPASLVYSNYLCTYLLIYLSSSHPGWCIRQLSNFRRFIRFIAVVSTIFQELHHSLFLSTSTVLLHVDFGLSPSVAQGNAMFVLFLSVWQAHLTRLILMSSDVGGTHARLCSSSFDTFIGRCIFYIRCKHGL